MGKNVFHVGGHGMGLAMNLINNMLGQIQTVAIAEAMVPGKKAGMSTLRACGLAATIRSKPVLPFRRAAGKRPGLSRSAYAIGQILH
jgi:hypothetical protein